LKKDHSYGIIPLQQREDQWYVLLIQHQAGHWAFPKGHADLNESPKQTAERELFEETGLRVVNYLTEQVFKENYIFTFNKQRIHKTVEYFVAAVEGEVILQFSEVRDSQWSLLAEAREKVSFPEGKKICQTLMKTLQV
jgi:8-oxo-dGTP pyrophosphatase MutT (NUDIX family)